VGDLYLFEMEEFNRKREKASFVERIKPFIKAYQRKRPKVKTYFGAPQKALGELLAEIGIGACISPSTKKHFDSYAFYFIDNGAFGYWIKGKEFNPTPFLNLVEKSLRANKKADFLVLPDLIGKGKESLEFSSKWAEELKGVGIPFALALQDGMEEVEVEEFVRVHDIKVLFVGGTTKWKWKTAPKWVKLAKKLGIKCHIGRVPSVKRVYQARKVGAHSIDTTAVLWEERKFRNYLQALFSEFPALGSLF